MQSQNTSHPVVHEKALCESLSIGKGTSIGAFTHILPGAVIGKKCNICDYTFIENDVVVGDNVTIKCGVQIWDGVTIEDKVFVGPNVTFTNDRMPRSKQYPEVFLRTTLQIGASIGANATILPGVCIGAHAMIGAGAVVTRDVPPHAKVVGNPGRIVGYMNADQQESPGKIHNAQKAEVSDALIGVGGVKVVNLPRFKDLRGDLTPVEFAQHLPFMPQRQFFVYGVPGNRIRGEHAHKACEQFLMALHGSLHVVVDDGSERQEIILDHPSKGLYLPAKIWGIQYKFSNDAVLGVYASLPYANDDYLRGYNEFLAFVKK